MEPNRFKPEHPNKSITIHEGEFLLKWKEKEINIQGEIYFDWLPSLAIKFVGEIDNSFDAIDVFLKQDREQAELWLKNRRFGLFYITGMHDEVRKDTSKTVISGINADIPAHGDVTERVDKITFLLPNFLEYNGELLREEKANKHSSRLGKLTLETDDFLITIDQTANHKNEAQELKSQGGYHCLHIGEIIHKYKHITLTEASEVLAAFTSFISFANGRRTAPLFLEGFKNGENVFTSFRIPKIDAYNQGFSWVPQMIFENLNSPWEAFARLWMKNEDTKDVLFTVVHCYMEANKNSGFYQGELIIATTALELIFNWWMISVKEKFQEEEVGRLEGKIRELLKEINHETAVPETFENLQKYTLEVVVNPKDGPKAISEIRNKLVHAKKKHRKAQREIPVRARYEALKLSLSYIEVALLSILEYRYKYRNRASSTKWRGGDEVFLLSSPNHPDNPKPH